MLAVAKDIATSTLKHALACQPPPVAIVRTLQISVPVADMECVLQMTQ
jgi:hypothetical protein